MTAYHQGENQHTFLDEDDEGGLTHVCVDLNLLIQCVTANDQLMGIPLRLQALNFLSSDSWLSEEALNHTHSQCASTLLTQVIGFDNAPQCQKCTSSEGTELKGIICTSHQTQFI